MNYARLSSPGMSFAGIPAAADLSQIAPGGLSQHPFTAPKRGLAALLSAGHSTGSGHTGLADAMSDMGGNPLLNFGLALLSQDGWATTPGPTLGARIGKAGAYTLQQQQDAEDRDYKRDTESTKSEFEKLRLALDLDKAGRPTQTTVGHDIIATDHDGNSTVLYHGSADPTTRDRDFQTWKAMPAGPEKDRFGEMLAGYRYTDDGEASAVRVAGGKAEVQGAARERHRAPRAALHATSTRVVNGTTFYKVGGGWFDNPEGR